MAPTSASSRGKISLSWGKSEAVWPNNMRSPSSRFTVMFCCKMLQMFQIEDHFASQPASKSKNFPKEIGTSPSLDSCPGRPTMRPCAYLLKLVLPFTG